MTTLVTLAGENLSTRMAADACLGCGVGETVASDAAGYQAVLRALIEDRALREALRRRLADPDALAFFSPSVTARHMDRALIGMVERHRGGVAPELVAAQSGLKNFKESNQRALQLLFASPLSPYAAFAHEGSNTSNSNTNSNSNSKKTLTTSTRPTWSRSGCANCCNVAKNCWNNNIRIR